jgi:hypothetical protein
MVINAIVKMPQDLDILSEKSEEHKMKIDPVGFILEIINNIGDERDLIRELISNAAAKEVNAKKIEIKIYESDKGLSFKITDDGCGMNYTRSDDSPGRLDRFLNAAQGKQAGFESDEFGAKGLGTKLLYNSDRVEIETWDGGADCYRVIIDEPRKNLLENKKLVIPIVNTIVANKYPAKKGTSIEVKGWADIPTITRNFKLDQLEKYLKYYTVIGYTKVENRDIAFPEFLVQVGGVKKIIKVGFPYITMDNNSSIDQDKTVIFDPIKEEKMTPSGKKVKIQLKGAISIDTAKYQLTDLRGGVWLSVNGIPYFKLPTNKYSRKLNFTDDFARFVVECDDIRLNLSRSDFGYDESFESFGDAMNDTFNQIKNSSKFQKFYQNSRRNQKNEMQQRMNQKKEEYSSEDKRYVWYNGKMILAEPESEYDTAAIFWILEGSKNLPFFKFKTLQYAGYREGIDMLVDYQEEEDKEEHKLAYTEIEKFFHNLILHKHDTGQMSLAVCWKVDKNKVTVGSIKETKKPFKWLYSLGDTTIPVFEISQFPGIFTGTKKEIKEHMENKKEN